MVRDDFRDAVWDAVERSKALGEYMVYPPPHNFKDAVWWPRHIRTVSLAPGRRPLFLLPGRRDPAAQGIPPACPPPEAAALSGLNSELLSRFTAAAYAEGAGGSATGFGGSPRREGKAAGEWRTLEDYPPAPGSPRYQPFAQRMAAAGAGLGGGEGSREGGEHDGAAEGSRGGGKHAGAAEGGFGGAAAPGTPPQASPVARRTPSGIPPARLTSLNSPPPGVDPAEGRVTFSAEAEANGSADGSADKAESPDSVDGGAGEAESLVSVDGGGGEGRQAGPLQLGGLTGWYVQTLAAIASEEGLRGGPLGYSGAEEGADAGQGAWQGFGLRDGHASADARSSLQILLPDATELAPYTGA